jgi:hypothetical protein
MSKHHPLMTAGSLIALLVFLSAGGLAHGNSSDDAKATIGGAHVSVDYGRPSLKGRDPMKMIQPGQLWRLGADKPTTLESDKDLDFGGTRVPKGKYILLARYTEPGKWSLVVSTKSVFQYEPSAKVAEVPMTFREENDSVETLSIQLSAQGDNGVVEVAWGKLRLSGSFSVAK